MDRERFSASIETLDIIQEQLVMSITPTLMSCRAGRVFFNDRTDPGTNSG